MGSGSKCVFRVEEGISCVKIRGLTSSGYRLQLKEVYYEETAASSKNGYPKISVTTSLLFKCAAQCGQMISVGPHSIACL